MPATQPLYHLIGISLCRLSKEENLLLEATLFVDLYKKLLEIFRQQNQTYFHLMKFTLEMENAMLEENFVRFIIKDILLTEEYSLEGIARYTDTHTDVVQELASGLNTKPLAIFLRKIIELHKSVRRDLYQSISKKITAKYLAEIEDKPFQHDD